MQTLDQVDIANILEDAPKCEWDHADSVPCSEDVTHIVGCRCIHDQILSCANAIKVVQKSIDNGKTDCEDCGKVLRLCWWIRTA